MNYLKDKQFYVDRYDLMTIEDCCRFIDILKGKINRDRDVIESFKLADKKGFVGALGEIMLYYKKGNWYRDKEKTINEWIDKDRVRQEKYDNTLEPTSVFCDNCNWEMDYEDKTLYDFSNEPIKILFFFRCPKCKKGKGIFDNGEIFKPRVSVCPKCGKGLNETRKRKDEVVTTISTCDCGYKNKDVWDMKADDEEFKKREAREKLMLEKLRPVFCMSKKEGDQYVSSAIQTEMFMKQDEERKKKEADPRYQKARALKKLKVGELQKLIQEVIVANDFCDLNFDKPEIDRYIIISFSVQDTKTGRNDNTAISDLRRALNKALENTNWRLMSDGIGCRLGLLYGRIKGYESEDELANLY